jgi:hypothetical protein
MALYEAPFLDLAKLTLGAFIGSFVQGEAVSRRQLQPRETLPVVVADGSAPDGPSTTSPDETREAGTERSNRPDRT